jgi:predicted enzyme related to lactoylglutathione lyase
MKTTILGLRTVAYQVSDLEKAKAWYTKVFKTEPYFDEPFYVGFNIGGYELGLMPEEKPLVRSEAQVSFWGVSNMQQEYQYFLDNGATALEPPQNVGGEIEVVTVKDPWDNIIGLIYNPEFVVG